MPPPNLKKRRMTMRRKQHRWCRKVVVMKAPMAAKQLAVTPGIAGLLTRTRVARSVNRAHALTTMVEEKEKVKRRLPVAVPAVTGSILKRRSAEMTVAIEGPPPRAPLPVAVIVMVDAMMAEIAKTATAGAAVEVEAMIGGRTIAELGLPRTMVVAAAARLVAAPPNKW